MRGQHAWRIPLNIVTSHGTFDETVSRSDPELVEIASKLRDLIERIDPDVTEVAWPKQGIIGYGVGPKKMSEHYCYIGLYKAHVNLGFYYGIALSDPDQLLEGTGKNLRHIKFQDKMAVDQPAIRDLITEAMQEREQALNLGG